MSDRAELRVLTRRELGRATLSRQLLLERSGLPLLEAVERIGGLQAQSPPAPYIGLWTRLASFDRPALTRAIEQRRVVKATLMRATLHLVTRADYPMLTVALHDGDSSPVNATAMAFGDGAAAHARTFIGDGERTRAEVLEWLSREHDLGPVAEWPIMSWYALRVRGHVVHAPSSALWNAPVERRFIALDRVELPEVLPARIGLVRRYLAAFGPSTRADLANWSGVRVRDLAPAVEALEPLRRFRDQDGRELVDLPRAPLPAAETPAPVRFLPKWDSVLLGHADRRRVLPEEYRKVVIRKNGDVDQTFLVDGLVAGTWALVRGRIEIRPFAPLPKAARRELDDEGERLAAFLS